MKGHSSLDVFDFGLLLQALAQSSKTGTLRVVSGPREKYVHLDRSQVKAIYSPRSPYRIGRVLYHMRALELEDLREAIQARVKSKSEGTFGNFLVQRELVEMHELERALEYQIVEEVLEVFYWKGVSYEFFGGSPEETLRDRANLTPIECSLDAGSLLLQVTKIIDDVDKFNQILPSSKDVYDIVKDPDEFLTRENVPEHVGSVLELIDGERDMGEVLRQMRLNRFQVMELFYRLKTESIIRPKNSFELLMLAENRHEKFGPAKRSRLYERVSEIGVEGFDISLRMAEVYEEVGQLDKAAARYLEHAKRMEGEGDLALAEKSVARAVKVAPDSAELRQYLAVILEKLDRVDDVVNEYLEIARIYRESEQPEKAEPPILTGLALRPTDERLLIARIDVLEDLGSTRGASNACLALARIREEARDLAGAQEAMRRAAKIAPRALKIRNALTRLMAVTGKQQEAAEVIGEMAESVVGRTKDRPERGVRILEVLVNRLKELKAQGSPAMTRVAEAFISLGRLDRGLTVLMTVGVARIAANRWTEAREAYQRAAELAPQDLDVAETLALVHAKLGNREHALARLRNIASIFVKRGKTDRAEKAYREMLRLNPFSPDALIELARLKSALGDKKESARRLHQIGLLYFTMDNIEDAAEYLDEACRLDPSNAEYVRSLADCLGRVLTTTRSLNSHDALLTMLRARNDHTGTIDAALRVLSIAPDHELAADALSNAYRSLGRKVQAAVRKRGE